MAENIRATGNEGTVLSVESGSLTLLNSTFSQNSANLMEDLIPISACVNLLNTSATVEDSFFGGSRANVGSAVSASRSEITLTNSSFERNTAIGLGGAVSLHLFSTALIKRCNFSGNSAQFGGAVFAEKSNVAGIFIRADGNSADGAGGCFSISEASNFTLRNALVTNSRARGGGVAQIQEDSTCTLRDCEFDNSVADDRGGKVFIQNSFLDISGSLFRNGRSHFGGCLYSQEADVIIRHSLMENCVGSQGGGIYAQTSEIELENATLKTNKATQNGGAIYAVYRTLLHINGSSLSSNFAKETGAAISIKDFVTLIMDSSFVVENFATDQGGAIICTYDSNITATNSQILRNTAETGGAMYVDSGSILAFRDCVFLDNFGRQGGGIGDVYASEITLDYCSMGRGKGDVGGGIALRHSRISVHNTECHGNSAYFGGCFVIFTTSGDLKNVTFLQNTVETDGGALYLFQSSISIFQCKFLGNSANAGASIAINENTQLEIADSVFSNEASREVGGSIFCMSNNIAVQIRNVIMENNTVIQNGGAIGLFRCFMAITNSNFVSNKASTHGGAISMTESVLTLSNVTLNDNFANSSGGAIIGVASSVIAADVHFVGNKAGTGGAFAFVYNGNGAMINAVFTGNAALNAGGAICLESANLEVTNGQFRDNSASYGGTMMLRNGNFRMSNSDLNTSDASHVGGFIMADQRSSLVIQNTTMYQGLALGQGGAMYLQSSSLVAKKFNVSDCKTNTSNGGAVSLKLRSTVSCTECVFQSNFAGGRGGAVSFESSEMDLFAVQFIRCKFLRNNADYGGKETAVVVRSSSVLCCHSRCAACHQFQFNSELQAPVKLRSCGSRWHCVHKEQRRGCWRCDSRHWTWTNQSQMCVYPWSFGSMGGTIQTVGQCEVSPVPRQHLSNMDWQQSRALWRHSCIVLCSGEDSHQI